MREITKEVKHEIDGKEMTFQIRKMDALKGASLLKLVTEKLVPVFTGLQGVFTPIDEENEEKRQKIVEARTKEVLQMIPDALSQISEEETENLLKRCLQTVDILLPAGWQPVMVGNNFGAEELEYDIMTALILCYEVVEFNFGGFFGGKSLGSILNRQATSRQGA